MANKPLKVFVIGDTHFPWTNFEALKKIYSLIELEQPDVVIQVGDLLDQYVFSHFTKKSKITPRQDISRGIACAKRMWERVHLIVPKAECYQLLGNHCVRVTKRIAERLPELADFFSHSNLYQFKNVKVMKSDRDFLRLGGVVYTHGWLSKSIDHARYFNSPTVHGHRHKPTVETDGLLWSMDVGHIANENSIPLSYSPVKYTRWRMACGIIQNKKPRLILL